MSQVIYFFSLHNCVLHVFPSKKMTLTLIWPRFLLLIFVRAEFDILVSVLDNTEMVIKYSHLNPGYLHCDTSAYILSTKLVMVKCN